MASRSHWLVCRGADSYIARVQAVNMDIQRRHKLNTKHKQLVTAGAYRKKRALEVCV